MAPKRCKEYFKLLQQNETLVIQIMQKENS